MNVLDFNNTYYRIISTRIIQILPISEIIKIFDFHRNQSKMQIMYDNAHVSSCIAIQDLF